MRRWRRRWVERPERAKLSNRPAGYDVFVHHRPDRDGAALDDYLDRLAHDAGLAGVAEHVTVATPATHALAARERCRLQVHVVSTLPATDALERAIRTAARGRRHLVVLLGPVLPGSEVIAELIAGFAQDPMFGTAQPRFADAATDRIWPLPGADDAGEHDRRRRRATSLRELPPDTITPELLACCLVLRWELLIGIELADQAGRSLLGGLLHLLAYARRLGFRNLVRNRSSWRARWPAPTSTRRHLPRRSQQLHAADPNCGRVGA